MKKFIAAVLLVLCFGVAKAHMPKKVHPYFLPKSFEITGINKFKNYNVPFKVNRNLVITAMKKNKIETTVNTSGVEVDQTKIAISYIKCLRFRSGTRISFLKNDR